MCLYVKGHMNFSVGLIFCAITKVFIFWVASWIFRCCVMAFPGLTSLLILSPAQTHEKWSSRPTLMEPWLLFCIQWHLPLAWGSFELSNLSLVKMTCLFLGRKGVYLTLNLKNKAGTASGVYYKWDTNFPIKVCLWTFCYTVLQRSTQMGSLITKTEVYFAKYFNKFVIYFI